MKDKVKKFVESKLKLVTKSCKIYEKGSKIVVDAIVEPFQGYKEKYIIDVNRNGEELIDVKIVDVIDLSNPFI